MPFAEAASQAERDPCSDKASPCSSRSNSTSAPKRSTSRCKCFSSLQNWLPVLKQESASPQQERRDGRLFNFRSGRRECCSGRKSRPRWLCLACGGEERPKSLLDQGAKRRGRLACCHI